MEQSRNYHRRYIYLYAGRFPFEKENYTLVHIFEVDLKIDTLRKRISRLETMLNKFSVVAINYKITLDPLETPDTTFKLYEKQLELPF